MVGEASRRALACKYASTILRATSAVAGGLPAAPNQPTCNDQPFSGVWVHDLEDPVMPFADARRAVERAIDVNDCATTFDAERDPFDVLAPSLTCGTLRGCPADQLLVVCTSQGFGQVPPGSYNATAAFFAAL